MGFERGLGRWQRGLDVEKPRHHPLNIAIHDIARGIKGNRRDRGRRVRPDPRQSQKPRLIAREGTARRRNLPRAGQKIAGAGVIAKPCPLRHHILVAGLCQRAHIGPKCHKTVEMPRGRRHHRLLQHDFRKPHAVGIRALPRLTRRRADPPRHRTRMGIVPTQKRHAKTLNVFFLQGGPIFA